MRRANLSISVAGVGVFVWFGFLLVLGVRAQPATPSEMTAGFPLSVTNVAHVSSVFCCTSQKPKIDSAFVPVQEV